MVINIVFPIIVGVPTGTRQLTSGDRATSNSRRWMNRFNIKETEIYEYEFLGRPIAGQLMMAEDVAMFYAWT